MKIKAFSKAASIAALVASAAVVAAPAQKASAQINSAGASSVTTLVDVLGTPGAPGIRNVFGTPAVNPGELRYVVTGSGAGRTLFNQGAIDVVASDGPVTNGIIGYGANAININDPNLVVVNEARLNLAFPYNVKFDDGTPFDVTIDGVTACRILRGDFDTWDQVVNVNGQPGPLGLPIIRVARGDSSGTTDTLQGNGIDIDPATGRLAGFVAACNQNNLGFVPSVIGARSNNFNDGTAIPNRKPQDIIVNAASPNGQPPADPFGAANASGDDDNASTLQVGQNFVGSYTLGIINAVAANNGAIGYTETAAAQTALRTGAVTDLAKAILAPGAAPTSTIAIGPTYFVYRKSYGDGNKADDARRHCRAVTTTRNLELTPPGVTPAGAGFSSAELSGTDTSTSGSNKCDGIQP